MQTRDRLIKMASKLSAVGKIVRSPVSSLVKGTDALLGLPGKVLYPAVGMGAGKVLTTPFSMAKGSTRGIAAFAKKHPFIVGTGVLGAASDNPIAQALSPQGMVQMAAEPLAPSKMIGPTKEIEEMMARQEANRAPTLGEAAQKRMYEEAGKPSNIFQQTTSSTYPSTSKYQWYSRN